jgi:2-desacetyl-2-hydroxyethyl bacteriochlorophyllide A dehydrogenase
MRAFVLTEPGHVGLREWPTPEVGTGDVLVRPLLVGMCGTDLELIDGTIDPAYVRYPLVLGHEWVGQLDGTSSRVVVEGIIPCDECDACARGASNLCSIYEEIGFTKPGALADLISVPASLVHEIEDSVDLNDAVLIEPMAVVWRALTRLPVRKGQKVAVIGDGTIALLTVHLLRLFEPSHVTVIGRRSEQEELAKRAGADEFALSTPRERFDLVVEAAGTGEAVAHALAMCGRGGMVILLGLPPHGTEVAFAPDDLVNDDLIIQGSFSYTREAFADVVRRVNSGDLRPSFLITHRFTLEEAPDAVATLRGGSSEHEPRGKVVVEIVS